MRSLPEAACAAVALTASAFLSPAGAAETPSVELNTNVAGCADMRILSTYATKRRIFMRVEVSLRERPPKPDDYPCICAGVGAYYFGVFPRHAAAPPERVMSPGGALRAYSHDLDVGPRGLEGIKLFAQTVDFPYFKTAAGRPYEHYYIVFGCR